MDREISIENLSSSLVEKDGIWFPQEVSEISYPDSGNLDCLQVEDNSFWFKHRNNCIATLVKKYASGKIFWDVGGGNGFVAKGLQTEGVSTILVEPGNTGARAAHSRGVKHVICATFQDAGLQNQVIEAAGLFDVLEHIDDDLGFLKSLHDSMAKDGMIFITVPAYQFLWSKDDDYAGHYRRYTTKQLNNTLVSAGFSPVFDTYIFSVLVLPVFLFRTLPSKLGIGKDPSSKEKIQSDHQSEGFISKILDSVWSRESDKLKSGKRINFGGSCLVVAKKN